MPKHELEKLCQKELFRMGHKAILRDEPNHITSLDIIIDDKIMDIRSICENGPRTIRNGLNSKNSQIYAFYAETDIKPDSVCLYFHDPTMYGKEKMKKQIEMFIDFQNYIGNTIYIEKVYCVVHGADKVDIYDINMDK